jgi:hypothetical protein
MFAKIKDEFWIWLKVVVILLLCLLPIMALVEIVVGPALRWLLYDELYKFPTFSRLKLTGLRVTLISFSTGTILCFARRWMH